MNADNTIDLLDDGSDDSGDDDDIAIVSSNSSSNNNNNDRSSNSSSRKRRRPRPQEVALPNKHSSRNKHKSKRRRRRRQRDERSCNGPNADAAATVAVAVVPSRSGGTTNDNPIELLSDSDDDDDDDDNDNGDDRRKHAAADVLRTRSPNSNAAADPSRGTKKAIESASPAPVAKRSSKTNHLRLSSSSESSHRETIELLEDSDSVSDEKESEDNNEKKDGGDGDDDDEEEEEEQDDDDDDDDESHEKMNSGDRADSSGVNIDQKSGTTCSLRTHCEQSVSEKVHTSIPTHAGRLAAKTVQYLKHSAKHISTQSSDDYAERPSLDDKDDNNRRIIMIGESGASSRDGYAFRGDEKSIHKDTACRRVSTECDAAKTTPPEKRNGGQDDELIRDHKDECISRSSSTSPNSSRAPDDQSPPESDDDITVKDFDVDDDDDDDMTIKDSDSDNNIDVVDCCSRSADDFKTGGPRSMENDGIEAKTFLSEPILRRFMEWANIPAFDDFLSRSDNELAKSFIEFIVVTGSSPIKGDHSALSFIHTFKRKIKNACFDRDVSKQKQKNKEVEVGVATPFFAPSIGDRVKSRTKNRVTPTDVTETLVEKPQEKQRKKTSNCGSEYLRFVHGFPQESLDPETGLPVVRIAVFENEAIDLVYNFCVRVAPSTIPGAGMGAHLTYEGAMRLKSTCGYHYENESRTHVSEGLDGEFGVSLEALHPSGRKIKIKLIGQIAERNSDKGGHPLIDEYEKVPGIPFPARLGKRSINLGCYGPLLSSDRKGETPFLVKNFIFANAPEEYGFGVNHKIILDLMPYYTELREENQVIDITDDLTGMPHADARGRIHMYINESGHMDAYEQNVESTQSDDGNRILYRFVAGRELTENEQVELFVNYLDSYEPIRERQGYGANNINGTTKSDHHLATRLIRNFRERNNINEIIEGMGIWTLITTLHYFDDVYTHVSCLIDQFLREGGPAPTVLQVIALRRIQWLAHPLSKHLDRLEDYLEKNRPNELWMNHHLVSSCRTWIKGFRSLKSWIAIFEKLEKQPRRLSSETFLSFEALLHDELTEEVCFELRHKLVFPMDESTYCGVSRSLIVRLCRATALVDDTSKLSDIFMDEARAAGQHILHGSNQDDLTFDSTNILQRYVLENAWTMKRLAPGRKIFLVHEDDEALRPIPLPFDKAAQKICLHTQWYLCRMVMFIVNTFARQYLPEAEANRIYHQLCLEFKITTEAKKHLIDHEIKVSKEEVNFDLFAPKISNSGLEEQRIEEENEPFWAAEMWLVEEQVDAVATENNGSGKSSKQRKIKGMKQRGDRSGPGSSGRNGSASLIFWALVYPVLTASGWEIEKGNRPLDFYLLPPGIKRGMGYQNRKDFFDSVPTCLHALEHDERWNNMPAVKSILKKYKKIRHDWVELLVKSTTWPTRGSREQKEIWIRSLADTMGEDDTSSPSVAAVDAAYNDIRARDATIHPRNVDLQDDAASDSSDYGDLII